ncbi:MAG: superoxide dismutase family protein [Bdellovibrionales bacterium]|nr:superoxide dismutase family protein [Bdellovibrionales bacterium]
MKRIHFFTGLSGLCLWTIALGCTQKKIHSELELEKPPQKVITAAVAEIHSVNQGKLNGKAHFTRVGSDAVEVIVEVTGLVPPGKHGIHVHQVGDCGGVGASKAGGHFDLHQSSHGDPSAEPHHSGDLGNIQANKKGKGFAKLMLKGIELDKLLDKSLVIHGKEDDLKTQPSGNSGDRIGCGIIKAE